jgi:hypothetical protein
LALALAPTLKQRETADCDTPARRATSCEVTKRPTGISLGRATRGSDAARRFERGIRALFWTLGLMRD